MINKGEVECLYLNKTNESTKRSAGFSLKIVFFSLIRMTDSLIDTAQNACWTYQNAKRSPTVGRSVEGRESIFSVLKFILRF